MGKPRNEDGVDEGVNDSADTAEDTTNNDQEDQDENNRGERPENLHRRSDWFQKRHGGG